MNLTHKAIARMSGYRVTSEWRCPNALRYAPMNVIMMYKWYDVEDGAGSLVTSWFDSEDDAWSDCCKFNNLVEE